MPIEEVVSMNVDRIVDEVIRTIYVHNSQVQRCRNIGDKNYSGYGAKGIKVSYTKKEFVKWWVANKPWDFDKPTCGRKDHTKGYSFDNIEMQEMVFNCGEVMRRVDGLKARIPVRMFDSRGQLAGAFVSTFEVQKQFGIAKSSVYNVCMVKRKTAGGYTFERVTNGPS